MEERLPRWVHAPKIKGSNPFFVITETPKNIYAVSSFYILQLQKQKYNFCVVVLF